MQYQPGSPQKVATYQVLLQYLNPNSSYYMETMMWTDGWTDKLTPIYPPKLRLWGYN
jgi:hypothetical protein